MLFMSVNLVILIFLVLLFYIDIYDIFKIIVFIFISIKEICLDIGIMIVYFLKGNKYIY